MRYRTIVVSLFVNPVEESSTNGEDFRHRHSTSSVRVEGYLSMQTRVLLRVQDGSVSQEHF